MRDKRFIRAAKNLNFAVYMPNGCRSATDDMAEVLRNAILESECGASVADAIIALDRVKDELMAVALGTSAAYRMIQDYKIDAHGRVVDKE